MATIIYGPGHVKSTQGLLKILEVLVCFIGLLLVAINGWPSPLLEAYLAGTTIAIIVSALLLMLHLTKLAQSIQAILAYQVYFNLIWFIYLLVVSAVLLSRHFAAQFMAGGAFGLIASILYLLDAIDCARIDPAPISCIMIF